MTAAEQRRARVEELTAAADTAIDHARALELLADRIDQQLCPVERWSPFWAEVGRDCRRSARNLRLSASTDRDHAAQIAAADEARVDYERGRR